jgi:hypothetical protein
MKSKEDLMAMELGFQPNLIEVLADIRDLLRARRPACHVCKDTGWVIVGSSPQHCGECHRWE